MCRAAAGDRRPDEPSDSEVAINASYLVRADHADDFLDQVGALERELAEEGIIVWGGDERIRISLHVYNDLDDVNR